MVLAVLRPHLGPVEESYSLGSGGYAAVPTTTTTVQATVVAITEVPVGNAR
jgi:hypothetical protein